MGNWFKGRRYHTKCEIKVQKKWKAFSLIYTGSKGRNVSEQEVSSGVGLDNR